MFLYIILVLFCGFGMFGFWVLIWYAGVLGLGGGRGRGWGHFVGFYSIVAYLVSHFCIAGELLCGVGNAAVGPTFAPGYRITVNYCLLVDLLFTI